MDEVGRTPGKTDKMKIKHLIFLIHPCVYEKLSPEEIRKRNLELMLEREQEVKERWLSALDLANGSTLFLQLGGPESLLRAARERMGEAYACYVHAEFPGSEQMREYYRRLTQCIRDHIQKFDLSFDAVAVTSEIWGESFEGCAAGYGSAFTEHLGLKRAPNMRFEMTVFDSRFLHGAKRWEFIPLTGGDIDACLFECYDGTCAAIFQARLSAQWLDQRPILLQLDPTKVNVVTKNTGFTVWPEGPPAKGDIEDRRSFVLTTSDCYWIRGYGINMNDFREMIRAAVVCKCKQRA